MAKSSRGGKYGASKPSRGQLEPIEVSTDGMTFDNELDKAKYQQDKIFELQHQYVMNDIGVNEDEARKMLDAIYNFTGTNYGIIRNEKEYNDGWANSQRQYLEKYISKSPSYNGEIYRGLHLDNKKGQEFVSQLQKGATIDMGGISSWSSDKRVANSFASNGTYSILFSCKNKSGVGIKHLSLISMESEVLQSSKSKFKIKSISQNGNRYEVELQEV